MERRKREANFELLRIIAMLMIITLHYLDKGNLLPKWSDDFGSRGYFYWGIEAICIVSVNVYILISGYFGILKSDFSWKKIANLWLQIVFYSLVIGIIANLIGIVPQEKQNIYHYIQYIFPIVTEQYWFATAYIILFFLMPFLNAGMKICTKKQVVMCIFGLLLLFSVSKTLLPIQLPIDTLGMNVLWFICVYIIGGYIRTYGLFIIKSKTIAWVTYLMSVFGIWGISVGLKLLYVKTGKLENLLGYSYHYNFLLCIVGAVGLFAIFQRISIKKETVSKWICSISGTTFGVYLIHEQIDIRYVWPTLFDSNHFNIGLFAVVIVFIVCSMIEGCRKLILSSFCKKIKK